MRFGIGGSGGISLALSSAGPPVFGERPTAIQAEIRRIREALAGVQEGFSELEEALRDLLEQVKEEEQQ